MTTKPGLSENEYLAIVENVQKALMIEPFRPPMADVVALIGAWRLQQNEIERLKSEVDYWRNLDAAALERENEQLRAQLRPTHTTTCACWLCLDAYGPVDARTG